MVRTEEFVEVDWIKRWAQYAPDSIAIDSVDQEVTLSYSELYKKVNAMAAFLQQHHEVQAGDRVAVLAMNRYEYIVLFFALQKLGAILLPLNYRLAAPELEYQLQDATPVLLIYEQEFQTNVGKTSFDGKTVNFDQFIDRLNSFKPATSVQYSGHFDDTCKILYTSGTTGRPKGAIITNKMLFWNSINTGLRLNLIQQDVILTFAPFFHTGGWNVLTTPILHRGGKVVLLKKFEPAQVLELCEQHKVSILFGVPTMMAMLADEPAFEQTDLSTIRYAIVGGEPMPIPLIERWHKKGVPVRQGYGLTEFGPNVFSLNEEDAIRKKGSVGFANFYIATKIVNEQGKVVTDGEIGELCLKGPVCTEGYWNNPKATEEAIDQGWLKTGDLVRKDDEGYFYIVDRKKDMFISGAENVYPAEIEQVLVKHPEVKEVAVIGVPDGTWGEVGMAAVVTESGAILEEDLIKFCRDNLAKFKVPKHFAFMVELPKSDTGKIQKSELKTYFEQQKSIN